MLDEITKSKLIDRLVDSLKGGMFGDGQEEEYIRGGIEFKGLDNMTDQELVECYEGMVMEDDEFLKECQIQLAIDGIVREG